LKTGQYDQAIKNYTEAIRLDPKIALAYSSRGTVYLQLGKKELAIQDFEKALSIDPDDELAKSVMKKLRG